MGARELESGRLLISCGGEVVDLCPVLARECFAYLFNLGTAEDWYGEIYSHFWLHALELGLFLDLDAQLTPADQSLLRQRLDLGKRKLKQYAPQSPETRKRLASGLTTIGSVLFG